jgi:hypothetical protein
MLRCALLVALVAACGNDHANPDTSSGNATLSAIRNDIFEKSCAFGSCHSGASAPAKLQLSGEGICHALVLHTSCEFPGKMLVTPGKPEDSFLLDKVRGTATGTPQPDCANTNERMPLGATPLTNDQIAQIEDWIKNGASCGDGGGDAGVDAMTDSNMGPPAKVTAVDATATKIQAGDMTHIVVSLEHAAPSGGQMIDIDVADDTALGAPSVVSVPEGLAQISFDVLGKRPARPVKLTATSGGASKSRSITITGLSFSQIYTDPAGANDGLQWIQISNPTSVPISLAPYTIGSGRNNYTTSLTQLTGTIPAHACFVVGGPTSSSANGSPTYGEVFNFSPDLTIGSGATGQATGFALFDATITQVNQTTIPIDSVLCGMNNLAGLVGADGVAATPTCSDVATGHSVSRTDATTWVDQATPAPNNCTPISL